MNGGEQEWTTGGSTRRRRHGWHTRWTLAGSVVVMMLAAVAWRRSGLLQLPAAPSGVTIDSSGLGRLERLKMIDDYLHSDHVAHERPTEGGLTGLTPVEVAAATDVRDGLRMIRNDARSGLARMREGMRRDPNNLALANAYRMGVFQLKRSYLLASRRESRLAPEFPEHLEDQPFAFFHELFDAHPTRETKLHLALAWVDHMLLFPALEIKAPSSVEAVNLLTEILESDDAYYVPALFARGMNHLHRPARLVWPESTKTSMDAAERDIALCLAIGRKFGVGSDRLRALLLLARGDALIKAGRLNQGRSCWQLAQNVCHDEAFQAAVRRRYAWRDEEALERLEEELDRSRATLDRPMTDLSFLWN